ncbi:MAG: DUF1573 domain-containing protein [Planctomycetes bacterium]|nr:DUF1573 domain-containing protein [Planctomycetota bacterium]
MLALPLWFAALSAPLGVLIDESAGVQQAAGVQPARAPGPVAKFSVDHFDFGTVLAGTAASGELVIENVGDAPLAIRRLGVDCGCAKLHLSTPTRLNVPISTDDVGSVELSLDPGDKATLKITIDTTKLAAGLFDKKKLLVICSDPKNGALSVPFKVFIERPTAPATSEQATSGHSAAEQASAEVNAPQADDAKAKATPILRGDGGRGAAPVDPALAPHLEVDSYKRSFGTVYRGEKLKHTFTLKNTGKSDLTLDEIQNGCACAASRLTIDGKTIEQEDIKGKKKLGVLSPDEEAQLEVELKTAAASVPGKDAEISKALKIFSNDPARQVVALWLEATMISPFTVEPEKFDFGMVAKGAAAHLSAIVWSDQLGDFPILGATVPNPELMTVTVTRVKTEPGIPPTWSVEVDVSAAAPLGTFSSHVELQVGHERVKEIVLPVNLTIEPNVAFTDNKPDRVDLLDFEVMTQGTEKTIELSIENGDRSVPYLLKDAVIGTCRPTSEGFKAELVELEKGMKYAVKLTAPPTLGKASYFQGDIVLTAEHPDLPLRKFRFRGWYSSPKTGTGGNGK